MIAEVWSKSHAHLMSALNRVWILENRSSMKFSIKERTTFLFVFLKS